MDEPEQRAVEDERGMNEAVSLPRYAMQTHNLVRLRHLVRLHRDDARAFLVGSSGMLRR